MVDRACIRRDLLEHLHQLLFSLICLSCFVTLGCFVNSCLLLAMLLFHGFLGPNPWLFVSMGSWVPTPGCLLMGSRVPTPLLFSRPFGTCFIQPNPMISMPTSPLESLLLFTPWNQLNFDVTGFNNTHASRDNRSCHFHVQLLCRCIESAAPALSRASPCRLNDAFNVISFLHGSDISSLFLHTTIVCV